MRLNVNKILHTPDAKAPFHFEMDLSDLPFGSGYPVKDPVVVDGEVGVELAGGPGEVAVRAVVQGAGCAVLVDGDGADVAGGVVEVAERERLRDARVHAGRRRLPSPGSRRCRSAAPRCESPRGRSAG